MHERTAAREIFQGGVAAAAALLAMAGTAAAGLFLLDAGRLAGLDALAAAVVALGVGGSVEFSAVPASGLPFAMQGGINVMPLGVSLVGGVVLGLLLRRGRSGLFVRGAAAAAAFAAGIGGVTQLARGTVTVPLPDGESAAGGGLGGFACLAGTTAARAGLPFGAGQSVDMLDAEFSVALWPTLPVAAGWALVVVGLCWLAARFQAAAVGLRAVLWPVGAIAPVCLLAAWAFGGVAAAGVVLLVLPLAVFGALPLGLGVPWTVSSTGVLSCAVEGIEPLTGVGLLSPGGSLVWISAAALLSCGVLVAARTDRRVGPGLRRATVVAVRLATVAGAVLSLMTLLSRASVDLGINAFGSSLPVLDAQLAANPLLTLGAGLAGGAVAGFVASLLIDVLRRLRSVSWSTWKDRIR